MATTLEELRERYKRYVSENPETTGQLESVVRVVSYFIAGRFEESTILSELVYSASNLLVLLNDAILRQAAKITPKLPSDQNKLSTWLTILEYVEVFLEMAALRLWGNPGRWTVIVAIQIAKTVVRFLLLLKHKSGIQLSPAVAPLDREAEATNNAQATAQQSEADKEEQDCPPGVSATFTLKRSGRVIRTLSAAPPSNFRQWKLPAQKEAKKKMPSDYIPTVLNGKRLLGESLHIVRPLAHLFSLYSCGLSSWKPWILSCGIDLSSLCLMGDPKELSPPEKAELRRRTVILLYYLLRSPFYDRYSQAKLLFLLRILADRIPGLGLIIKPLLEYLPVWQKIYFYTWGL